MWSFFVAKFHSIFSIHFSVNILKCCSQISMNCALLDSHENLNYYKKEEKIDKNN